MAHLHTCPCGRTFRCDGVKPSVSTTRYRPWGSQYVRDESSHGESAWYWCMFECPDLQDHGMGLVQMLDAEFLQMVDEIIADPHWTRNPVPWNTEK